MKGFDYEIRERIAVLSEVQSKKAIYTKEINLVSFKGAEPKYDIRLWQRTDDEEKMLKGITLDKDEFEALKQAVMR